MQKYILAVSCAAVICGLCDVLMPKSWQKYIGILTGAMLLATLISPFGIDKADIPQMDFTDIQATSYDINGEISRALIENLRSDIENRILTEFSEKTEVDVKINTADGKITGVSEIFLSCRENTAIKLRLQEIYGTKKIYFKGEVNDKP